MSSRVTLELFEPISFGSERITKLEIRRFKAKDLRSIRDPDNMSVSEQLELISTLSGQPMKVIDELDGVDLAKAGEIIRGFSKSGQATGEKTLP